MIKFDLNPFTIPLTNVHTLTVNLMGGPFERRTVDTEGVESISYLQTIMYQLIRTTEEGNVRIAEQGEKEVPAEIAVLLLGQLTGTLTPEQKVMIQTFLQTFNSDITLKYEN